MKQMLRWGKTLAAMVLVTSLPALLQAQSDGRFTGTVLDPSGAVVAGATVTIKNERTGIVKTVVTDTAGRYVATGLSPSTYTISVKAGNFAPLVYTNMQLVASQEFAIDLNLQAAGVQETVTVVGQAARSTSARRASASMSANGKSRTCRSMAARCRS